MYVSVQTRTKMGKSELFLCFYELQEKLLLLFKSYRMSQVIEETIRGGPGARGPSELEGLACPRTKSPLPSGGGPPGPPPGVPASSKHPASFRHNTGNGDDYQDYPTMEGLGARFGPYMTKRVENNDLIVGPPPVPGGRNSHPNKAGPMGPNAWDSQHPNSAYGYRSAHFQQQQQPPSGSHPPGPPPMGSSGPPGAPPPFGNSVAGPPRKRASPSSSMPVLPPKKQHVDSVGGVDYSFHKGKYVFFHKIYFLPIFIPIPAIFCISYFFIISLTIPLVPRNSCITLFHDR